MAGRGAGNVQELVGGLLMNVLLQGGGGAAGTGPAGSPDEIRLLPPGGCGRPGERPPSAPQLRPAGGDASADAGGDPASPGALMSHGGFSGWLGGGGGPPSGAGIQNLLGAALLANCGGGGGLAGLAFGGLGGAGDGGGDTTTAESGFDSTPEAAAPPLPRPRGRPPVGQAMVVRRVANTQSIAAQAKRTAQAQQVSNPNNRSGCPKLVTSCRDYVTLSLKEAERFCISSELDLNVDFVKKMKQVQKDCAWRKVAIQDIIRQQASIEGLEALYADLHAWDLILTALMSNQDIWEAHIVKPQADLTLHKLTTLHQPLDINTSIRKWWMHETGVHKWFPLWQRYNHHGFKLRFTVREAPLRIRNAILLVSAEQATLICPAWLVAKMPEEFPTYIMVNGRKDSMLRRYWSPAKVQEKLWKEMFKCLLQLNLDQASLLTQLAIIFRTVFPDSFKEELDVSVSGLEDAEPETPASKRRRLDGPLDSAMEEVDQGEGSKRDEEDMEDEDLFGDLDLDFDKFDAVAAGEAPRQPQELFTEPKQMMEYCKDVCALVWPDKFREHLAAAIRYSEVQPPRGFLPELMADTKFGAWRAHAVEFQNSLIQFEEFQGTLKPVVDAMNNFGEEVHTLMSLAYGKSSESGPAVALASVTKWCGGSEAVQKLSALKKADKKVGEALTKFSPKVMGSYMKQNELYNQRLLEIVGEVLILAKVLYLGSLHTAEDSSESIPGGRAGIVKAGSILGGCLTQAAAGLAVVGATEQQAGSAPEDLKNRITRVADFLGNLCECQRIHYEYFKAVTLLPEEKDGRDGNDGAATPAAAPAAAAPGGEAAAESVPDKEMQEMFQKCCVLHASCKSQVAAEGTMSWAFQKAAASDAGRVPWWPAATTRCPRAFFNSSDVAVIEKLDLFQEVVPFPGAAHVSSRHFFVHQTSLNLSRTPAESPGPNLQLRFGFRFEMNTWPGAAELHGAS